MLTVEKLIAYGADTAAGLARCMNNEVFYLRLVGKEAADANLGRLREAMAAGDMKAAFEAAHAIKGAAGNLGLTPIYAPTSELTELLRGAEGPVADGGLTQKIENAFADLQKAAE